MDMSMKNGLQYYLSIEGETEKWYFENLQKLINNSTDTKCRVKLIPKIQKSPLKYVKSIPNPFNVEAFHICDYESNDAIHVKQFDNTLQELKKSKKIRGNIKYELGYSNYSFELWMILHKVPCLSSLINRKHYLIGINEAYNEDFQFLSDYKSERNFKRVLSKIELSDVIDAIYNAKEIRNSHKIVGHTLVEKFGVKYYRDNPDLTIHECIEKILHSCGLI